MSLKNCLIVLWVYIMYVLGLWLFLSGFLLKRIVIHQHSTSVSNIDINFNCDDVLSLRKISNSFSSNSYLANNQSQLHRFNRTVILVIDALRFDFVYQTKHTIHGNNEFYSHKMPVFQTLLTQQNEHVLLFPLFADPPTTTLQRLKAITTGGLPTFIDISFNFASFEVIEDNIVHQMNTFGKKVIFMGDDTWESIYPKKFHRSFPFPSFNVKDLDTVDDGILEHLYEEISKQDADVIIAHFLGVDHCGHRFGPSHPEMARKLRQMNSVIEKVVKQIENDTLLVVLGDHGMTENGDHGGESFPEVNTALFMYSPSQIMNFDTANIMRPVLQVDIVPTLSLLLGLPIPFSNLGSSIDHAFTLNSKGTCFHQELDPLVSRALASAENAVQVLKYIEAYEKASNELPLTFVSDAKRKMLHISSLWNNISTDFSTNKKVLSLINKGYKELLSNVQNTCRKQWATFNLHYMVAGSLLLLGTIVINLINGYKSEEQFKMVSATSFRLLLAGLIIVIVGMLHFYILIAVCITAFFGYLRQIVLFVINTVRTWGTFPNLIILLFFSMSFSNSFVVYEDSSTTFLLQSVILYRFLPTLVESIKEALPFLTAKGKSSTASKRTPKINWRGGIRPICLLCLLLFIKFSTVFRKCREEQILCNNSDLIVSLEKLHQNHTYSTMRLMLSIMSLVLPYVIFYFMMTYKYSAKPLTVTMIGIKCGTFFVCVLILLRWWVNILPAKVVNLVLEGNEIYLNHASFLISILMCVIVFLCPFVSEQPWQIKSKEVYQGSFFSLAFCVLQLLQLVAGDAISVSFMLMSLSVLLYIILINTSSSPEQYIWTDTVAWFLFCRHWFYSGAHQPTFTAIQWDAAFLLYHKEVHSYLLSGALVVLNTFSSNLFFGFLLPFIVTCTESAIFTGKSLLRLHMKYVLCHAIKVFGTVLASFILRRHLMVWMIFSPKLLFEVIGFIITMISVCIGHLFLSKIASQYHNLIRMNLKQVFDSKEK